MSRTSRPLLTVLVAVPMIACASAAAPTPPAAAAPTLAPRPAESLPVTDAKRFAELVHPSCLWNLMEGDSVVLSDCEPIAGELEIDTDGASFTPADEREWGDGGYYGVLGFFGGRALVSSSYNTGGTGQFTTIGLFVLRDGTLTLTKQVVRGDRCHGGIGTYEVTGTKLVVEVAMTPHALLELGGWGELETDKGYPDLWGGANDCIGWVTKTYSITEDTTEVTAIDLNVVNDEDLCYVKVLREHEQRWHEAGVEPTPALIALFGADYATRCKV